VQEPTVDGTALLLPNNSWNSKNEPVAEGVLFELPVDSFEMKEKAGYVEIMQL